VQRVQVLVRAQVDNECSNEDLDEWNEFKY
jgi:hypothetical protein